MPEHLKALIVILGLAAAVFAFGKGPACAMASLPQDFNRRRNVWFAITLAAFLAHNYWLYILMVGFMVLAAQARDPNKLALYFLLLPALPAIPGEIPGLGLMNYFFEIDYVRLLALTVLLPSYLRLRKQPGIERFGGSLPDKLVACYLILPALLMLEYAPFTTVLRKGVFYAFVDIFLPYYVASRSFKSLQDFRDALMALAVGCLVLAAILVFESLRDWLLYSSLRQALGARWAGNYLARGESLRALGTTGHPIHAGYVMFIALGCFLYLRGFVPGKNAWRLGLALLIAGLVMPVSRGPWVGAAAMLLVYIATGPAPVRDLFKLALAGAFALPFLLYVPAGQRIVDLLPFVGTVEEHNVAFRQNLMDVSIQVILQNPFFGRHDVMETPEMESLRGNDGLIDIVNTYIGIGLATGLVGVALFAGAFLAVAWNIYGALRKAGRANVEPNSLGRALLAMLVGTLVFMGTVSPISISQAIWWSLAGLGLAYARVLVRTPQIETTARRPLQVRAA